ncbi:MAG: ABC transporter permease, partial [Acutalibacteraceae bacterium]
MKKQGIIGTLSKSIREYKRPTILTPVSMILEVVMEVLIPTLMGFLIDEGINKGDMGAILRIGGLLIVCCILSIIGGVLGAKFGAEASCGFAKNLRHDMYYRVQNFSFSNIDKFSTASLVTRMTTDVTNVQNSFQMIIRIAVRAPMMLIFSLIMAFRIKVSLSLLFLAVMPVLAIGLLIMIKFAHPIFEKVFKIYDKLNNVVQENLRGIRVVKIFVREDYEEKKFKDVSERIYKGFSKAEKLLSVNGPLMQFCMYTCTLLISWFGAKMIVSSGGSDLQIGQLQ